MSFPHVQYEKELPYVASNQDLFHIGRGDLSFLWIDHWVQLPQTKFRKSTGQSYAVAVSDAQSVVIFQQANPAVMIYNLQGKLLDSWDGFFPGAHGLTLVKEQNEEFLWLSDSITGEVVKTTMTGETVMSIVPPDRVIYDEWAYRPTAVAVDEERFGGSGDIWIADGHGSSYVHRYDKTGKYRQSINGTEGPAGAFQCPHGVWIDGRKLDPELYIADRENRRIQVYDLEGRFKRTVGEGVLSSPCAFAAYNEYLIIAELWGRITLLGEQDEFICYLGENDAICDVKGWPNLSPDLLMPGRFNSPHAVATDRNGNIYVAEWIRGGRLTKLAKKLII